MTSHFVCSNCWLSVDKGKAEEHYRQCINLQDQMEKVRQIHSFGKSFGDLAKYVVPSLVIAK